MKKRVLVTGSTQGIGKATAKRLVDLGYEVIVHCSKDKAKAKMIQEEIGAASFAVADLSKENEVDNLFVQTGPVDCLVLNASYQKKQKWDEVDLENMHAHLNVNVISTIRLIQLYAPSMKESGFGRIVTLGSTNQHRQHPELPMYAATKCAVLSFIKNVAKNLAPYGVTVNNVAPGAIATPRNSSIYENPILREEVEKAIPAGRFGESEEIASYIAFILSEKASYITGADLVIDGGLCL